MTGSTRSSHKSRWPVLAMALILGAALICVLVPPAANAQSVPVQNQKTRTPAGSEYVLNQPVEVLWGSTWYPGRIKAVEGPGRWLIGYDGYAASWDEVVGTDRLRRPGSASPATAAASAPVSNDVSLAWPSIPAGAQTPLEGVYLTVRTTMFGSSISTRTESWFFTRNGRFARDPRGGVSLQNLSAQPLPDDQQGSYWVSNGNLVMAWADGREAWRSPYDGDPSALTIDTSFASRWSGFTPGWRLDGSYEGGASIAGASSASTLNFRRDGTFTRSSALSVSSGGAYTSGSNESAGTYRFDEYTLTLQENGNVWRYTVFGYGERDAAGRPERLFLDSSLLDRDPR